MSSREQRLERVGLGVALVLLGVVAVQRVDTTALWQDEAYTLGALHDLGSSVQGTHGTMALYYVVLWVWARVGTATWWLRSFSVVCAAATLVLLRQIARRVGGPRLVALAPPLCVLSPMFAWKATEARSYALETLLTTLTWWVTLQAVDADTPSTERRWLLALAPLGVAGVLCHGFFVAQLVGVAIVLLLAGRPLHTLRWGAPAALATAATLAWLLSSGIDNVGTTVTGGVASVVGASSSALLSPYNGIAVLLVGLGVVGGLHLAKGRPATATAAPGMRAVCWVPVAWAVVPWLSLVAVWAVEPRFNPRYLAPSVPGLVLLLGSGALALDDRLARRRVARAASGASPVPIALAMLVAMWVLTYATAPPFIREDWRGAARFVAVNARPGDGIVFEPADVSRPPFEAAWREVPHRHVPQAVSPRRPLGRVLRTDDDLSLQAIGTAADACTRLWVVEYEVSSSAQVTPKLARDAAFASRFREVAQRRFADDIVVTQFVRTASGATRPLHPPRC